VNQGFAETREYKVVDTANPVQPMFLAVLSGVQQRLAKNDTGTFFLLNKDGVTIIRPAACGTGAPSGAWGSARKLSGPNDARVRIE
jgi:hypothetical protein